jgi:hypothetical protein
MLLANYFDDVDFAVFLSILTRFRKLQGQNRYGFGFANSIGEAVTKGKMNGG